MFPNGVSENTFLLSMRLDTLFTEESEYKENHIAVANQRDEYERANYPQGVFIVRLDTGRLRGRMGGSNKCNMGRFRTKAAARRFIRSRVEPVEVAPRTYPQICDCLSWTYQIEYAQCKGIVFERCSHCLFPTKHIFLNPLNAEVLKDFDLDEFLGL